MTAELKKAGMAYEFVPAFDGRDLDLNDPSMVDPVLLAKSPFPANHGATVISHIRCYERMIAAGLDAALVLEDDVLLPPDVDSLADSVGVQLTGAEVGLLSFGSRDPLKVGSDGAVPVAGGRVLAFPIDGRQLVSAGAYVITREGCERMMKSLLPLRTCADEWAYFFREGYLDRVRCVVPLSVRSAAKLTSTQGSYVLANGGLKQRLLWPIVKLELPVLHQILTYRRQRIQDRFAQWEIVDIPFIEKPSRLD